MPSGQTTRSRERLRILQVAYYDSLLKVRSVLLENSGYAVTSVLGNAKAMRLGQRRMAAIDLIVVGFSSTHPVRSAILHWFKRHYPEIPVVVLQAHLSEKFPGAACATPSEDPEVWLEAVANCLRKK